MPRGKAVPKTAHIKRGELTWLLDESLFPREAILRASYQMTQRAFVRLQPLSKNRLAVVFKGKEHLSRSGLHRLADEFQNELLHQAVRLQVSERTQALREAVVGRALWAAEGGHAQAVQNKPDFPAPNIPDPGSNLDYLSDPLGIAIPWEEKHVSESTKK